MITRRRLFVVSGALALLSSCGPPPEVPKYPDIRFNGPPILLEANQVEIRTLAVLADADRAFPVPPAQAAQNWARDRLRASGRGSGPARYTINTASATIKDLPIQGGISGTFTDQVSQQYDVALDVTLEILDQRGMAIRTVHVTVSRSQSVLQSATPNQREQVRYDLVKALMTAFDQQIEQQIRDNFGLYLISR